MHLGIDWGLGAGRGFFVFLGSVFCVFVVVVVCLCFFFKAGTNVEILSP